MFTCRITLYVPSTQNGGNPLPEGKHESLTREVCKQFARKFGGCTITKGIGFWESESGELIEESVTLVTSYHALLTEQALAFVIPIAQTIKTLYGQEAVTIETEQGLQFI